MDKNIQQENRFQGVVKKYWWIGTIFFIFACGGFFIWKGIVAKRDSSTLVIMTDNSVQTPKVTTNKEKVTFTHQIFDPSKVSYIAPLGELNGGYNETQPITGICVNNKGSIEVEIYAPTDMTLVEYSFASDGRNKADRQLSYKIGKDMRLHFDHITWVSEEVQAVTPPTQNSATTSTVKQISFKAGDLVAKTTGTAQAHNWNIYLTDKNQTNIFVNQARYESIKDRYAFVNAVCPFDYYEKDIKQLYIALMGATTAGQSTTCGNPSKDVKGTISGLWHLSKVTDNSTFMGSYVGNYGTPFSIYKNSAGEIILYEVGRKRYILGTSNLTLKDPATITESHCYNLTEWPEERQTRGYAYFRVVNDMEMKVAYSGTGGCPVSFPENNSITYYR